MSDAEEDESASGGPPPAQGQQVSAQQLQSSHPLWARARGQPVAPTPSRRPRGGTGPAGGGGGSQNGDGPRFEPLSAMALELESFRRNADGDSALFSEDGSELSLARAPRKRAAPAPRADDDDDDADDGGFSALADSEADEGERRGSKRKRKSARGRESSGAGHADAAMYAKAAFGGAYDDGSDAESVSQLSGTSSSRKRAAYKAAFPVKGIDCVGCALVKKIAPVEKFVKDHFDKMSEESLWKMAALTYVREVQEPRKREGVLSPDVSDLPLELFTSDSHSLPRDYVSTCTMSASPPVCTEQWSWKDLRTHFLIHCSDARIARAQTVRQLQTMRYCVEQRLMRVDNGEREVDRAGCDLMLKVRAHARVLLAAVQQLTTPFANCTDHQGGVGAALAAGRRRRRRGHQEAAGWHDRRRRKVSRARAAEKGRRRGCKTSAHSVPLGCSEPGKRQAPSGH
ncbi:MAG: hypothetical protein ACKVI4_16925 [Actinomycetales bacterium]